MRTYKSSPRLKSDRDYLETEIKATATCLILLGIIITVLCTCGVWFSVLFYLIAFFFFLVFLVLAIKLIVDIQSR